MCQLLDSLYLNSKRQVLLSHPFIARETGSRRASDFLSVSEPEAEKLMGNRA